MVLSGDSQRISRIYRRWRRSLLQFDHFYFVIPYRTLWKSFYLGFTQWYTFYHLRWRWCSYKYPITLCKLNRWGLMTKLKAWQEINVAFDSHSIPTKFGHLSSYESERNGGDHRERFYLLKIGAKSFGDQWKSGHL